MIKNLIISIYKPNEIYKPEEFNTEFASISYYYLLKLQERKLNIDKCGYIKILITNCEEREWIYKISDRVLYIDGSLDFKTYSNLSRNNKMHFQFELVDKLLKNAFSIFKVDCQILEEIKAEIEANDWQMRINKKFGKSKKFELIVNMDLDAFTFTCDILKGGKKITVFIFKSIPTYFSLELFRKTDIYDDKLRFGSAKNWIFEIDLENKTVETLDKNNLALKRLMFKS